MATDTTEYELGVPIPGQILPPERWTQTALKRYPEGGPIDWTALFGRKAPVVLDIGCGNGRFTLQSAVERPDFDHLAVDTLPVVIRYARRRGNQRGLTNVRFAVGGGRDLLSEHVAPQSVREIHCYHPQPYYDSRQVYRRLITPEFLTLVHRALEPGGLFVLQTDNPGYWRYAMKVVPIFFDCQELHHPWPDAPEGRTRREIIAMRQGLKVFRGTGTPRSGLSEAEARAMAEKLLAPTFDADRRLRELDEIEKQSSS
ncbi:MAG: tRNA (guanine(46)-N(7))-methyltransferase TrmB [Gemmataceae bacterium]